MVSIKNAQSKPSLQEKLNHEYIIQWNQILDPDGTSVQRNIARRRALRQSRAFAVIALILMLGALAAGGFPVVQWIKSSNEQASLAAKAAAQVEGWPYPQAEDALRRAREYNRKLASHPQWVIGEASDPFATKPGSGASQSKDLSASEKDADYMSQLAVGDGMMGSIKIPKISVDLPIYHGTSNEVLDKGSGHLYGSSLPVGGKDTHSVLTGHRGLVSALMFTRIDEMRIGDPFYINVMGETYGYKVDRISVIQPDDVSQLKIVPGEDRVTLMTCTPYGVNTQRLLVSAVRASIPLGVPNPSNGYDWWIIAAVAASLVIPWIAGALTWRNHSLRWLAMRHSSNRMGY